MCANSLRPCAMVAVTQRHVSLSFYRCHAVAERVVRTRFDSFKHQTSMHLDERIACATHEPCEDACAPTARNQSAGETRLRLAHERQPSRSSSQHRHPQSKDVELSVPHISHCQTDNRQSRSCRALLYILHPRAVSAPPYIHIDLVSNAHCALSTSAGPVLTSSRPSWSTWLQRFAQSLRKSWKTPSSARMATATSAAP